MNLHPSKILFYDEKLMFQKTEVLPLAVWFWLKAVTQQKGLVWTHMSKHNDKSKYFLSKGFSDLIDILWKTWKSWQQKKLNNNWPEIVQFYKMWKKPSLCIETKVLIINVKPSLGVDEMIRPI